MNGCSLFLCCCCRVLPALLPAFEMPSLSVSGRVGLIKLVALCGGERLPGDGE